MKPTGEHKRIVFIDLMRAFAILMMVQGHLIDALLAPEYRDTANTLYYVWNFMRGLTAPVFFFASGAVFAYLLKRQEELGVGFANPRVYKGFRRTLMLLALGYILQINPGFYNFFATGNIARLDWFIVSHVLQVIAISIALIVSFYLLFWKKDSLLIIAFLLAGNLIFLFNPDILEINFNAHLPKFFANYFTTENGSAFTIFPWAGFALLGAGYGITHFHNKNLENNRNFLLIIIIIGLLITVFAGTILNSAYYITQWDNLLFLFKNNALYFRLGQVLIVAGILGLLAKSFKIPQIITTIGSETLSIYFWHCVIIYGSITIYGLKQIFGQTRTPWECILLVIPLEILMIFTAVYTRKLKVYLRNRNKT